MAVSHSSSSLLMLCRVQEKNIITMRKRNLKDFPVTILSSSRKSKHLQGVLGRLCIKLFF